MEIAPTTRMVGLCTPAWKPARSAQIGLKIVQFLQQHEDVFAARCEICSACSTMCSQPLELSEQVRIPAVRRRCASPLAARAAAAARPAQRGIRARARRLSADKFGRALSPSARWSLYRRGSFENPCCASRSVRVELVAAAIEHDLDKSAQLRCEVLLPHRETPIAVFNGVDEPIWSRSGGANVLHADTHQ